MAGSKAWRAFAYVFAMLNNGYVEASVNVLGASHMLIKKSELGKHLKTKYDYFECNIFFIN